MDGGHIRSCFVTYTINLLEGLYGMYMADVVGKREFTCSRQIIYSTIGGHGGGGGGGSALRDELCVGNPFPTDAQRTVCVFVAAILAHE